MTTSSQAHLRPAQGNARLAAIVCLDASSSLLSARVNMCPTDPAVYLYRLYAGTRMMSVGSFNLIQLVHAHVSLHCQE